MQRVLLTAFDAYDRWPENASWLALSDLTRWYDGNLEIVTRRYPVDLARMSDMLRKDLQNNFDLAIHLGQAPGSTLIQLEAIALNLGLDGSRLIPEASEAYRSNLSLDQCSDTLREAGIPCEVSYHAGTFLCNAALFLSQHYAKTFGLKTQSLFVHLPLAPLQAAKDKNPPASMSSPMAGAAIAMIMQHLTATLEQRSA